MGVVGAIAGAVGAGDASSQTPTCQPAGPVVVRDADLVVWTQDAPQAHVLYIGCRTATGRAFTVLDFDNDCISPTGGCDAVTPRIRRTLRAGRWLALNVTNGINGAVALADVSAGRAPRPSGYQSVQAPREIALNATGTLAWIAPHVTEGFARTRRLMVCDRQCRASGSRSRLLARGQRLHGLRVDGARVRWRDGDHRHAVQVR